MTDLLYSETEDDLRSAVRSLLADRCGTPELLAAVESGTPGDLRLWPALAKEMGLAGLLVPEESGGQGGTHREAAVVLEELGRSVAPVPYLTSAVVATEVLTGLGPHNAAATELLTALSSGDRVAVLAVPLASGPGSTPWLPALSGSVGAVADAAAAQVLLVPTADGLYAVGAGDPGVTVDPLVPLDLTRPLAAVTLDGAQGNLLAGAADSRAAVRQGLLAGAGLLASEQLGIAEWCLEETVRYTRERHQFNRPIGGFQALKHRMAQLWLEIVSARAAARNAADALATDDPEKALAVSVAQAYCSRVAVHAAEECVQLHGGIGMTWEHPAHLYLKRAKSDAVALGSAGTHRETLAELVGLPGPQ
ncbi:acyl-CoA dehydrogenase family protein [Streptomyces sp. NBC_00859]|uniref:acyl-CoA dehydrogenase family protein n=1 Tax=Streptomyces sp. NBC_00859 TaxID=2903682 RepID=UPI00386511A6|nr:acyl-CoA/acyl-ACP dehydrogenase [Streptomyces sp. NBC_00859]